MSEEMDRMLDLRNTYDHFFKDYKGDAVVEAFREVIDKELKEIKK